MLMMMNLTFLVAVFREKIIVYLLINGINDLN